MSLRLDFEPLATQVTNGRNGDGYRIYLALNPKATAFAEARETTASAIAEALKCDRVGYHRPER